VHLLEEFEKKTLPSSFFYVANFHYLAIRKKVVQLLQWNFGEKGGPKSPDFEERNLILPVFDYRFQPIAKIPQDS
jgi:hypothetical protein